MPPFWEWKCEGLRMFLEKRSRARASAMVGRKGSMRSRGREWRVSEVECRFPRACGDGGGEHFLV